MTPEARIQAALAALPEDCWVFMTNDFSCMTLLGGTFPNGAVFTEDMCCLPCTMRKILGDTDD